MAELSLRSWVLDQLLQRRFLQRQVLQLMISILFEANEAFAAQSIAVARDLGFDMSKVM